MANPLTAEPAENSFAGASELRIAESAEKTETY